MLALGPDLATEVVSSVTAGEPALMLLQTRGSVMQVWHDLSKRPASRVDRGFYDKVRASRSQDKLVDKFVIAPYSGRGFVVKKGQTFRVIEETGPQIGAVAFWNAHNPKESFFAAGTFAQEGVFVKLYDRMISDVPWRRPMMTCMEDTVVTEPPDDQYHHHPVGTHCSPETVQMRFGVAGLNACRLNLLQAIEPFGLGEKDLHDSISVHQKVYLEPKTGKILIMCGDGKPGDYIEFYVEMDLVVGVSVCPYGDGSANPMMYKEEGVVRSLGIEIYDTGIEPKAFPALTDWRPTWTGRWLPPSP